MVFVGTIYVYGTHNNFFMTGTRNDMPKAMQKKPKSWVIVTGLCALYIVSVGNLGLQWQIIQLAFVENGQTRFSVYASITFDDDVINIATSSLTFIGYILADGLLVCPLRVLVLLQMLTRLRCGDAFTWLVGQHYISASRCCCSFAKLVRSIIAFD